MYYIYLRKDQEKVEFFCVFQTGLKGLVIQNMFRLSFLYSCPYKEIVWSKCYGTREWVSFTD